ncbi:MAG TPA: hypothetical protein VHJ78_13245, partial [Actinomycetota bacterium]|nr:hypothetical protein [Actinomycetota bacterium]
MLAVFCSSPVRCTGALFVVSAVVFGLVLLNISVAQTSFHLSDLQKKAASLQVEQRRLRYEVARAESPQRIVEMSASLGLVPPASQEFLQGPTILASDSQTVPLDSHASVQGTEESHPDPGSSPSGPSSAPALQSSP